MFLYVTNIQAKQQQSKTNKKSFLGFAPKLVFKSLKMCYFILDYTTVLLWSKLRLHTANEI